METASLVTPETCMRVGGYACLQIPTAIESAAGLWKSVGSWVLEEVLQPFKLKYLIGVPLIVSSLTASSEFENRAFDVFDFIDPLIGTINGGKLKRLYLAFKADNT